MKRQAEQGDVDFITGDYLAEVSLAEDAEAVRNGRHDGWFPTCWDGIEQSLDVIAEKDIKIIVNGGGLNPRGLAEKVQMLINERAHSLKVAYVSGDDVFTMIQAQLTQTGSLPPHLDSSNPEVSLDNRALAFTNVRQNPLVAANAYLGARAILAALNAGADIIICGRVSDASPVIAAAWWWHSCDVTADITNARLEPAGKNRVRLTGITGSPPPPTTKLGIFYHGGYQCQLLLNATGYNTELKWSLLEKQIKICFLLTGNANDSNPQTQLKSTTYCRVFAQAVDESTVSALRAAWVEFVMQHFSGMHYSLDLRTAVPARYKAYYPALYPQSSLEEYAHLLRPDLTIDQSIAAGHPPRYEITQNRSDKGGNVNFGIFPKRGEIWPWFQGFMSRERLRQLIGCDWKDEYFIERTEFPLIHSVHFVVYGILGRGSSSSVLLDNLGKGFADYIRDKLVDVPVEIADISGGIASGEE
ncbi:DUF1446 domain-containing [Pyrenophora seminiperda CCB06]|uniref:DUF1446 domain-containing n=1 Tax=Pyrenophora seminiperda CCB06 TaxID=1302712 RepID=A0A3M7M1N3_9PLEO|nr:DUF1446 domain-containing [Pyrenophora seminiperda CCB06]